MVGFAGKEVSGYGDPRYGVQPLTDLSNLMIVNNVFGITQVVSVKVKSHINQRSLESQNTRINDTLLVQNTST